MPVACSMLHSRLKMKTKRKHMLGTLQILWDVCIKESDQLQTHEVREQHIVLSDLVLYFLYSLHTSLARLGESTVVGAGQVEVCRNP